MLRRIAVTALLVAFVVPAAAGTAATKHSAKPVQVNKPGRGPHRVDQYPVAGSKHYLAYISDNVLKVRRDTGATKDYGVTFGRTWSFAPPMLTAASKTGRPVVRMHSIAWWNVATGRSGRIRIPKDDYYLGAAPNGVVIVPRVGSIRIQRLSLHGKLTTLGHDPFPDTNATITYRAYPSDRGFVLRTPSSPGDELSFQAWRHPGVFTKLQVPDLGTPYRAITCDGMSDTDVGCLVNSTPALIPLDGGPPTSPSAVSGVTAFSAAVAGDTLVFPNGPDSSGRFTLASESAGDVTPQITNTPVGGFIVSAYGKAVMDAAGGVLLAAADATHTSVVVPAGPEAAQVSTHAISRGRIYWTDNRENASHTAPKATVRQRSYRVTGGQLSLGRSTAIGRLRHVHSYEEQEFPAEYLQTGQRAVAWGDVNAKRVMARSPYGRFRRSGILVGVSNRWLLTQHGASTSTSQYSIFDMKRRTSSTIDPNLGRTDFGTRIVLYGNHLAVIDGGSLQVINLATGSRRTIDPKVSIYTEVSLAGHWIVWGNFRTPHVRNLATGRSFKLPLPLQSLTPHAAVLLALRKHKVNNYYVTNFHGKPRRVLTGAVYYADPVLHGRVLTWLSFRNQLEAKVVHLP